MIGVPLHLARDGILLLKPVVSGLEYDWCDIRTEAIRLSTVHDGTFRITQMVRTSLTPSTACHLLPAKISFFLILKKFVQI